MSGIIESNGKVYFPVLAEVKGACEGCDLHDKYYLDLCEKIEEDLECCFDDIIYKEDSGDGAICMNYRYAAWIRRNYPTKESCKNRCNIAVAAMVEVFSSLTVQVGFANGILHCWCIDDDSGKIVDPTSKQFSQPVEYLAVTNRFLDRGEYEPATKVFFLPKEDMTGGYWEMKNE